MYVVSFKKPPIVNLRGNMFECLGLFVCDVSMESGR